MATNRLVLGSLCFVLLMLIAAAHGEQQGSLGRGVVVLYGTARCNDNPRTINNATLQVTINGTMVAAGETNSSGQFLLVLVANVTSKNQLMALMKKEATITAPSVACGGDGPPGAAAAGRKLSVVAGPSSSADDGNMEPTELIISDNSQIHIMVVESDLVESP